MIYFSYNLLNSLNILTNNPIFGVFTYKILGYFDTLLVFFGTIMGLIVLNLNFKNK